MEWRMEFDSQERAAMLREIAAAEAAVAARSRDEREALRAVGTSIAARMQDEVDADRHRKLIERVN
jgi:hypothetical protein